MKALVKEFWQEEDGLQTVEMVLILLVVVGLIVTFKGAINTWFTRVMGQVENLLNDAAEATTT